MPPWSVNSSAGARDNVLHKSLSSCGHHNTSHALLVLPIPLSLWGTVTASPRERLEFVECTGGELYCAVAINEVH